MQSTTKTMATPNSLPEFDLTKVFEWLIASVTFIVGLFKLIDSYFAHARRNKQEFIEKVVQAAVKATLESELKDMRDDINTLFKYREEDRKHIDGKFDKVMIEFKK